MPKSGGGGGGCYVDFREANPPLESLRIEKNNWRIKMNNDCQTVTYHMDYSIVLTDTSENFEYWTHISPYPPSLVQLEFAKHSSGTLKSLVEAYEKDPSKSLITIFFEKPLSKECLETHFSFSFTAPIESTIVNDTTKKVVSFYDWIIHDCLSKKMNIEISLPARAQIINFIPQTKPPIVLNPIEIDSINIPPNGLFSFMVSFKIHRFGFKFWGLLFSILMSGLIGLLINKFS